MRSSGSRTVGAANTILDEARLLPVTRVRKGHLQLLSEFAFTSDWRARLEPARG
jgi:hypothetical protein